MVRRLGLNGSQQNQDCPCPYGGRKPVQRKRHWRRRIGIPNTLWAGYRVYFGRDGDTLIVLLGGGAKSRQQKDVENARDLWQEYKHRKQQEA